MVEASLSGKVADCQTWELVSKASGDLHAVALTTSAEGRRGREAAREQRIFQRRCVDD
jgi:hypothetical protein